MYFDDRFYNREELISLFSLLCTQSLKTPTGQPFERGGVRKSIAVAHWIFFRKEKGDLISRMTNDVYEVEVSLIGALEGWIRDPLTILITLSVLFLISPQLTLFILLLIPVLGLVIGRITRSLKRISQEVAIRFGETLSVLDETLSGLRVVKAFGIEPLLTNKFKESNRRLLASRNRIGYRRDLASPLSEIMGVAVFTGVLYYGGKLVLQQQLLEASAFIGFLGIFYNIINPAKALSTSFSNMRKGSAAINRIEEILNAPLVVEEAKDATTLTGFSEGIEFRNVSFSYGDKEVVENISFTIPKGKQLPWWVPPGLVNPRWLIYYPVFMM